MIDSTMEGLRCLHCDWEGLDSREGLTHIQTTMHDIRVFTSWTMLGIPAALSMPTIEQELKLIEASQQVKTNLEQTMYIENDAEFPNGEELIADLPGVGRVRVSIFLDED